MKAREGDERLRAILHRYDRMLAEKYQKEHWKLILRKELVSRPPIMTLLFCFSPIYYYQQAWQEKLRSRPILTGAPFRATHFNRPLPRLHPQPAHISGMINKRRRARELRIERGFQVLEWTRDMQREVAFEAALAKNTQATGVQVEKVFRPYMREWGTRSSISREAQY